MEDYGVIVGAGTRRSTSPGIVSFPHRWTETGVTVEAPFTGGHLLHLAAAGCVLNDVYREADLMGIEVRGVLVTASGGFDTETWRSTGIRYTVEVDTVAAAGEVAALLERVDMVAEIPRSLRTGTGVERVAR